MSDSAFLPDAFRAIAEAASRAAGQITGDPRTACFHSRFTLLHPGGAGALALPSRAVPADAL